MLQVNFLCVCAIDRARASEKKNPLMRAEKKIEGKKNVIANFDSGGELYIQKNIIHLNRYKKRKKIVKKKTPCDFPRS